MIQQIQLKNYRSHHGTAIELAPFNLFLGGMGAGKTTILHALSLLLAGQNPLINAKSEGLRREITLGESEFHIACKLSSGLIVEQKVTKSTNAIGVNGSFVDVRQQRGKILGALGNVQADCLMAHLDPFPFFERDVKIQRSVLLQLMATKEIDAPALVKRLRLAESFTSVGQITQLVKDVKEVRVRVLNREIEALQKQIPAELEFSASKMAEIERNIVKFKAARDQATKKQGATEEWQRILDGLNAEAAADSGGSQLEEKLLADATKKRADAEGSIVKMRETYAAKLKALADGREKVSAVASSEGQSEKTLKVITGMGKRCGVPGADVFECPLTADQKKSMAATVKGQFDGYKKEHQVLADSLSALQKEADKIEAEAKELKKTIEAASGDIASLAAKLTHRKELVERLEAHRKNQPDSGNWPQELAKASESLAAAEIDLLAMRDAQGSNNQRALKVAEVVSKQTEAADLLAAVKELEDLKDTMLVEGSSGFVEIMASVLKPFGFKEVVYSAEPFGFFVDGLMPDQMSGGQKVLVEAALRLAAAKTSGLGMMVIDNTNMTGEGPRNALAKMLMASGVQVIVCSTTDSKPQIPKGAMNGKGKIFWFNNSRPPLGPTVIEQLGV